jgi:site-specific DNA recombinase
MAKDSPLIPAVAYIRKSSKGVRKGKQKQEKSLQQQREEVFKHAHGRFRILRWYEDEGISGWKRDAARPGFARMLADANDRHDFRAIICDDMDRFSRADVRKVFRDIDDLAEAGVDLICSVKGEEFRIHDATDPGMMHSLVASAMANHEFSRRMSRRITLARRNRAAEGKRSGGPPPYGLEDDGAAGLRHGDPAKLDIVRWLYDHFVNQLRSLHWLANMLNARKVPGPGGSRWFQRSVRIILRQPAYRGDFHFNRSHRGQFHGIDAQGEVVEAGRLNGGRKVFSRSGCYQPVVDPALWDRAQQRLDILAADRSRRNRSGEYALTGVLVCDHCGSHMHGVQQLRPDGKRSPTVYKCSGKERARPCFAPQVRESAIVPFILETLQEEVIESGLMDGIIPELPMPPEHLTQAHRQRAKERERTQARRDKLAAQLDRAERNLLLADDDATFKRLHGHLVTMQDELDQLEAELALDLPTDGPTDEEREALRRWWDAWSKDAIRIPTKFRADTGEWLDTTYPVDPAAANAALMAVGAEFRLRFRSEQVPTRAGGTRRRNVLVAGRFKLGQSQDKLPQSVLDTTGCCRFPTTGRVAAGRRRRRRRSS